MSNKRNSSEQKHSQAEKFDPKMLQFDAFDVKGVELLALGGDMLGLKVAMTGGDMLGLKDKEICLVLKLLWEEICLLWEEICPPHPTNFSFLQVHNHPTNHLTCLNSLWKW
ncbi:hypothetical protein Dimus_025210 [Dionaea muscipula]